MKRKPRVIVAGSVNMDIVGRAPRYPRLGETIAGTSIAYFPGGKGANQAVAAARLGAATALIGRTGDDAFGRQLRAFLRGQGIDLRRLAVSRGAATGIALILLAGAANAIMVIPGANGRVSTRDVAAAPVAPGDVLLSQLEIPPAAVEAFFRHGKRCGAVTILNAAPARRLQRRLLESVDILLVNESELAFFSKRHIGPRSARAAIVRAASRLRLRPDQAIIVTRGARGAVAVIGGRTIDVPGKRVEAVDTTGAGDCFAGALAAALAGGLPLAAAMSLANAAAALSVQRPGAAPSMPTRAALLAFRRR